MYGIFGLSIIIQAICIIHALKNGKDRIWIYVIFIGSIAGCLAYFFIEMLPDLSRSSAFKSTTRKISKTLDPTRDLRQRQQHLELSNSAENTIRLAEEYLANGQPKQAYDLYAEARKGIFTYDPCLMLGQARTCFEMKNYQQTIDLLDELIKQNPDFKSSTGHMLYARSLELLGKTDKALDEYEVLANYYTGPEAQYRYAKLLQKTGNEAKAQEIFNEILKIARLSPKHYRRSFKHWIDLAEREI